MWRLLFYISNISSIYLHVNLIKAQLMIYIIFSKQTVIRACFFINENIDNLTTQNDNKDILQTTKKINKKLIAKNQKME